MLSRAAVAVWGWPGAGERSPWIAPVAVAVASACSQVQAERLQARPVVAGSMPEPDVSQREVEHPAVAAVSGWREEAAVSQKPEAQWAAQQ